MRDRFDFDGALKEVFQQDRPTLLNHLTRGIAVKEFLNVELPKVQERRVDLAVSLEDGSILHIEVQGTNDRNMAYRMVEYWPLVKQRFKRPLRQVVLYVGPARLALAVLAGGGDRRVPQILRQAAAVKGPRRDRLLAKILLLSGLRGIGERPTFR